MEMEMKGLLKSEYDVHTYTEYIYGRRWYFTIGGMCIEKSTTDPKLHENPVAFLANKYVAESFDDFQSDVEEYIETYEMEKGIVVQGDVQGIYDTEGSQEDVSNGGKIAYIEDSILYVTDILSLPEFVDLPWSNFRKESVMDSFVAQGPWNFDTFECGSTPEKDIKKLKAVLKNVTDETETLKKSMDTVFHSIDRVSTKLTNTMDPRLTLYNKLARIVAEIESKHTTTSQIQSTCISRLDIQYDYLKKLPNWFDTRIDLLTEIIEDNEKVTEDCLEKLNKCIDNIAAIEQCCQKLSDDAYEQNKSFDKRIRTIEMFMSTIIAGLIVWGAIGGSTNVSIWTEPSTIGEIPFNYLRAMF